MNTKLITMTTPSDLGMTSDFGMPVCGHDVFTPVTGQRSVDLRGLEIARDRAGIKGQVARIAAYVPGTHAWSPPLC